MEQREPDEGHHQALLTEWGKVTVTWWDAQDRRTAPQRLRNGGEERRPVRMVKWSSVERLPLCSLDATEHLLPPRLGILYFVEGVDVESFNPAIRIAEVRTQLLD
jgi:hypothetical protein